MERMCVTASASEGFGRVNGLLPKENGLKAWKILYFHSLNDRLKDWVKKIVISIMTLDLIVSKSI